MNVKTVAVGRLRRDRSPAARFKRLLAAATPRIAMFPAMVYWVQRDDLDQRLVSTPVASWADVTRIEQQRDFINWAGDPRTGQINIVIR